MEKEFTREDDARIAEILGLGKNLPDPKPYLTNPTLETEHEIWVWLQRRNPPTIKLFFKHYFEIIEIPTWAKALSVPKEYTALWEKTGDIARALFMATSTKSGRYSFRMIIEEVR